MNRGCVTAISIWALVYFLYTPGFAQADGPHQPVDIEILETASGVTVRYTADPLSVVVLADAESANPGARLTPASPAVTIEERQIATSDASRPIEISIEPDLDVARSTYPVLSRIEGAGFVLYAPRILPKGPVGQMRYRALSGESIEIGPSDASKGYVYLGGNIQSYAGFDAVFSDHVPDTLRSYVESQTQGLLEYYTENMGTEPAQRPFLVIDLQVAEADINHGSVTENQVILVRIQRRDPQASNLTPNRQMRAFLAHELFHLWTTSRLTQSFAGWWVHEGAAELASWLAIAHVEKEDDGFVASQVEQALNACVDQLRTYSMEAATRAGQGSIRYTCGAVLHWFAAHKDSDAGLTTSAFEIWQTLWPSPRANDSPEAFEALIAKTLVEPYGYSRALFSQSGTARWADMAELFNTGQTLSLIKSNPPTDFSIQVSAAQAIALSACGQVWGIGLDDVGLFVQAPPECAYLSGSPNILSVNAVSPTQSPQAFLSEVVKACRASAILNVELQTGGEVRTEKIACTSAVEMPPPVFSIQAR